jgi:hypothetical protein
MRMSMNEQKAFGRMSPEEQKQFLVAYEVERLRGQYERYEDVSLVVELG